MLYIGSELSNRMNILNLTVQELADKSFLDENDIKKMMHNDIPYEEIDEFDLNLLCGVLHCKPEYFIDNDVRKTDLLNSTLNRGTDDDKSTKIKAKLQDFMNDFEFINKVLSSDI